nr:response regulator [Bacteroidales bacterium]
MENSKNILHIAPRRNDHQCRFDVLKNCTERKPSKLLRDEFVRFMEADLIIIKLDYMRPGDYKQGIDLLKLLRLHHINTYCVVYSNQSLRYHVDADANKSILLSKGVTYVQMPGGIIDGVSYGTIDESHRYFAKWLKEKSPENLEDYFLHDYKQFFSDNRHFHANWWAPLRIMEYLKRADHLKEEDMIYSNEEAKADKESLFGQVLRYIKTMKEHSVWDRKVEAFITENKSLVEANRLLEESKVPIEEVIDKTITDEKLKEAVLSSATAPIDAEINENKEVIESRQQEINDFHQAKEIRHSKNASTPNIEKLRYALAKRRPRILFLDDMAGYGWDYVLQRLIYKEDRVPEFNIWSYFPDDVTVTDVANMILNKTEESGADLVIMDLRLKNEKGEIKAKDLSGIQLLEALREKHVACPILVMTASKNPETIEQVYSCGADACWRKEGIDENNSSDPTERVAYTWSKIEQLLTIINTLSGEEFGFLYKTLLKDYYHVIEQNATKYWWEIIGDHNATGMQSINKAAFLKYLDTCVLAYQKTLVDKLKGKDVMLEFVGPCKAAFSILEAIHPPRKWTNDKGEQKKVKGFGDLLNFDFGLPINRKGNDMLDICLQDVFKAIAIRNEIIHHREEVVFSDFADCIQALVGSYLMRSFDYVRHLLPQKGKKASKTPRLKTNLSKNQNQK